MNVITSDAHARDVNAQLAGEKVSSIASFSWQKQLRHYWQEIEPTTPKEEGDAAAEPAGNSINSIFASLDFLDSAAGNSINSIGEDDSAGNPAVTEGFEVYACVCDARFRYGCEYLGVTPRLVITPLTDRIYITAMQALRLCLGCAPAGPAGTGKTETTKDLAGQLGMPVYVFNCSDQMNYKSIGQIFKGLASSGAWGCFDEFNRIAAEVLSVVIVQYSAVLDAIKTQSETFAIPGDDFHLSLNPSTAAFITMNPGYLGRTELPEGLKALFRPVTVVKPDIELICENMLMAEGYGYSKQLAHKFVTLYRLCGDLLSKQLHYDWGLRAIKSVLVVAGGFKRYEPEVPESLLLMRSLRDSSLSKLHQGDLPVFADLLADIFPGLQAPSRGHAELEGHIARVGIEMKLTPDAAFRGKICQLHDLLATRHCVFVMGDSGNGKSTAWAVLAGALTAMGMETTLRMLDPKAISTDELYGKVDLRTRDWKDGILSCVMRELSRRPDPNPKWIILDGDLDPNWIESMNSVMDDNKILTLANNERIPLTPSMRMIFELSDLAYATPATVSRAGILYLTGTDCWSQYYSAWVGRRSSSPNMKEHLKQLGSKYLPQTMQAIDRFKSPVPIPFMALVQTLCSMVDSELYVDSDGIKEGGDERTSRGVQVEEDGTSEERELDRVSLEVLFVFACVWAFGGHLSTTDGVNHRLRFSNWWRKTWKSVKFPESGTVFDYYVDESSFMLSPWIDVTPKMDLVNPGTAPTPRHDRLLPYTDSQPSILLLCGM